MRDQGLLLLSGVTATDAAGRVADDPAEQFEQAFRHLQLYLHAARADMRDILEMRTYHVELRRHLDTFVAVKDRHLSAPHPAWSTIGVAELITPRALVEMRVVGEGP